MAQRSRQASGASRRATPPNGGWQRPVGSGGGTDDLLVGSGPLPAAFVSALSSFPRGSCVDHVLPVRVSVSLKSRLVRLRATRSVHLLTDPALSRMPTRPVVGGFMGLSPGRAPGAAGSFELGPAAAAPWRRWRGVWSARTHRRTRP